MSGDTHTRHCFRLMLAESFAHKSPRLATAGHNRMVLSLLADAIRRPSGLNATLHTPPVWSVSGSPTGWPVRVSHNRTVPSSLADARYWPSGLNATLCTQKVWPVRGPPTGWPLRGSHTRTVSSLPGDARDWPVGLHAT